MSRGFVVLVFLCGLGGPVRADGLRVTKVMATAADVRAAALVGDNLWLGTMGGLVRIGPDGVMTQFTSLDGLPSHAIRALAASDGGMLWLGTGAGLVTFQDGHVQRQWPGPAIVALAQDPRGRIVAATIDGRVVRPGAGLETVPVELKGAIYSLAFVGDDLYVGTSRGLRRWDGQTTTRVRGLADPAILALACDGESLLVGSPAGLARVHGDRVVVRSLAQGLAVPDVRAIVPGTPVVVGTWGGGVYEVDHGHARPQGSPGLRVQALARRGEALLVGHDRGGRLGDRDLDLGWLPSNDLTALASVGGTIFAGTFDRGLVARTREGETRVYTEASGLLDDRVNALASGSDVLWIGLERGVCRLRGGIACWRAGEGPAAGHVAALLAEPDGLWVGSSGGLTWFDGRRWTAIALPFDRVTALSRGADGALWVGSAEGLARLDPVRFEVIELRTAASGGLPDDWVTLLTRDGEALWVGTYSSGLARIERDGTLTRFDDGAWINPAATASAFGRRIFGGLDEGIIYPQAGRLDRLRLGLPSLDVTALLPDADGVWAATRGGLARLSRIP